MKTSYFSIFFVFLFEIQFALCKNILAIFPHSGKSHYFMYQPYIQKLQERGHNVTVITWFKEHNLKNVEVISFGEDNPVFNLNLQEYEKTSKSLMPVFEVQLLNQWGQDSCKKGLSNPQVKELIQSKRRFDLVIVEYFNTDCYAVFAHLFKAPLVGVFSSAAMPWHNDRMGNPDNPSYIPNIFTGYPSEMSFSERVKNTLWLTYLKIYHKYYNNGPTDKIIKRHLGKGIPRLDDIVKNTSMFFVNSHYSVFQPRPFVPGVVEIGGIHIQEPKKLPSDLQKYLDNSKNGVIYFSLGTVTNGSSLPPKKRDALLRAFGSLSYDVLWKWEVDDMPGKPKNVLIKKWVSQNDVLAHPNVKLFVTHGGLMGTLEAVSHGVPMIFIPLFGDQFLNAASVVEKGTGILIDYFSLNEIKFTRALKTILEDSSYSEKAKLLSARFKERPLTPMNTAIYWTEYVLKFKGALHLRPAVVKLSWFSENLIDVFLFCLTAVSLVIFIGRKVIISIIEQKKAAEELKKKKN